MNHRGFTLIEVLVAISLFALIVGTGYGTLIALEQLHHENEIYFQMIHVMQTEIDKLRNYYDLNDSTFSINSIPVTRDVEQKMYKPNIERIEISYRWQMRKKQFHVDWEVDRFFLSPLNVILGAK